jgi:carboxylesterase
MFSGAFSEPEHEPFLWAGSGDAAALMVHGFPGSPAEMRPLARALHDSGWTVEGLLLPGFGAEIETLPARRSDEWLVAVEVKLAELRRGHDRVLLLGNSMGGALTLQAAARGGAAGLALISPFWKLESPLWTLLPVFRVLFPAFPIFKVIRLDFDDPQTRRGIRQFMPDADLDDPAVQREVREFRLPLALFDQIRQTGAQAYAAAPYVGVPALIVQGRQDELVRPALTQQLGQQIPGLRRLVEVDGGHDLLNTARPAWPLVRAALLDFAEEIKSGHAP